MNDALDSESPSMSRAESFADFLEGFKSARMSFEPLENWLFRPQNKKPNGDELLLVDSDLLEEHVDDNKVYNVYNENHKRGIGDNMASDHDSGGDNDKECDEEEFDGKEDGNCTYNSDSDIQNNLEDDEVSYLSDCDDTDSEECSVGGGYENKVDQDDYDDIRHFDNSFDECSVDGTNERSSQLIENNSETSLLYSGVHDATEPFNHSDGRLDHWCQSTESENVVYRRRKITHNLLDCDSPQATIYRYPQHDLRNPLSEICYSQDTLIAKNSHSQNEENVILRQKACYPNDIGKSISLRSSSEEAVSGYLELDDTAKQVRLRNRITQEILDTEVTYHRHLELIVKVCI